MNSKMNRSFLILILAFLSTIDPALGQATSFEFSNPTAIELTNEKLQKIIGNDWRVTKIDTENRGVVTETRGWTSLRYFHDGTFTYNQYKGHWHIMEDRYIKHELKREDVVKANFGGFYAVTSLTDSTLTLTKLLTSTHDMKRVVHLHDAKSYHISTSTYDFRYKGKIDQHSLDSISRLSSEMLFMHGVNFNNDTIFLPIEDTILHILRKKEKSN